MKPTHIRLLLGFLATFFAPLAYTHSGFPLPILIAFPWGSLSFLISTILFVTTSDSGKRMKQFILCVLCFPLWLLVFIGPINMKLWDWSWELVWAIFLPCALLIVSERISVHRIKRIIKLDENRLSLPSSDESQLTEMKTTSSTVSKPTKLVAQFSAIKPEGISYNRAVIDQERDSLTLSIYEGESNENLVLTQSCVATNWKELN